MRAVVTGAAGFVGSHLCERLVADGHEVVGVDCFTDYYAPAEKLANISLLAAHPRFALSRADLSTANLKDLIEGCDVVFHQAGQPGVRGSWAAGFGAYCTNNVLATQRLLETARAVRGIRVVYASSSSIYGNTGHYPVDEADLPRPASPYGVTKLAAEHLCALYAENYGLQVVSLRYFTVYGPRQRPDMAFRRLIEGALTGRPFSLFGDGTQIRDFTFIGDVVEANVLAARSDAPPGSVLNVAGGTSASIREVIALVGSLVGREIAVDLLGGQPGDVLRTGGTIERAMKLLGWRPRVSLEEGLAEMVRWAQTQPEGATPGRSPTTSTNGPMPG